jgi:hypothetical protein
MKSKGRAPESPKVSIIITMERELLLIEGVSFLIQ